MKPWMNEWEIEKNKSRKTKILKNAVKTNVFMLTWEATNKIQFKAQPIHFLLLIPVMGRNRAGADPT